MKIVISLGGSLIVPNEIDYNFLKNFKKSLAKIKKDNKVIIVTGGGSIARKYIEALRKDKLSEERCSLIGIKVTKLNAMFLSNFLDENKTIPDSLEEVKKHLKKSNVVVCGALGYHPDMTSDGDSAMIARYLHADIFINMTNVKGLFDKDPRKFKNAKFISEISFSDFMKISNKIKYRAGQHFVLDQSAAKIINRYKVKTAILQGIENLEKAISGKRFIGTIIR
ncbi:UMP kinase [Candidatus Woesearchaeota archaeon]|nr:UMP kinase [Candidatus Woesearchaeota archaeon]